MKKIYYFIILIIGISCSPKEGEMSSGEHDNNTAFSTNPIKKELKEENTNEEQGLRLEEQNIIQNSEVKRFENKNDIASMLLQQDKNAKIEFAAYDNTILKTDTSFQSEGDQFEINYTTSCLNDKSVLQEVIFLDKMNSSKIYRISHNYETIISVKKNGRMVIQKNIKKDFFEKEVDHDFLTKSILKHPDIINFDQTNKELTFAFLVGVPSTDWAVIAKVRVNQTGNIWLDAVENVSL